MKILEIKSNKEKLSATLYDGSTNDKILIIASATGVKQEFYKSFATFISSQGITVITFDYLGIGRSLNQPIKELKNNASDWGRNDLEAVIHFANTSYPNAEKILLGHSIGGQLVGLAKSSLTLNKIILVAAQSGYWKYWKGIGRIKMWFNWHVLFPLLLNIFGYLNSKKLSGMENLPKHVANQWRNWGKQQDYIISDKSILATFFKKISCDITAFSIEGDEFAPKAAVDWMTSIYAGTNKKSIHLKPVDFKVSKIGHFGIFKPKFQETIWQLLLDEIR